MKIPQGTELSGKAKVFNIQRSLKLAFGDHKEKFGVIVDCPVTGDDKKAYAFCGWLGAEFGKTEPVVVEFNENPGVAEDNKARPAMKISVVADGVVTHIAALWRQVSTASGKPFYAGKLGDADLLVFPYEKAAGAAADAEPQV